MAKGPTKKMKLSMWLVMLGMLVLGFGLIIVRLVVLQLIENDKYQNIAIDQQLRDTMISPKRGTIYDTNMKVLAQSATVWTVYVSPQEVRNKEDKEQEAATKEEIATKLSELLDVKKEEVLEKLEKKNYYEIIKKKVEKPERDKIFEWVTEKKIRGVHVAEDSKRYYPYGEFAAGILGFTGTDNQGLGGIEAQYDSYLTGTPGRVQTAANAQGTEMPFEYEMLYEAKAGNNVELTIDETLQHYLEKHLTNAVKEHNVSQKGAGIIMNVKTGEILAMATKPDFDPNDPMTIYDSAAKERLKGLKGEELDKKTVEERNAQWRNKVVSDTYEPGSVFKVVTSSATLEENLMNMDTPFTCTGVADVSGVKMHCHLRTGHGAETFRQSLQNSCNPFLIAMGQKLGKDKFMEYLQSYGLTTKTGIDLPGEADSQIVANDDVGPVELASMSFGQSNSLTPMQMATAFAASANGGKLVQPHVVKQITDENGNIVYKGNTEAKRQVISEDTSKKVMEMLELTVNESASSKTAGVKGYRVGGKSGTSQKLNSTDDTARVASFAAVAPAEDPEIMVMIILDEPHSFSEYGSQLCAPVVGNVLSEALPYLGIMPNYTAEELAELDVSVPSVVGDTPSGAQATLRGKGLKAKVVGSGAEVVGQFPAAGQSVSSQGTVILYSDKKNTEEQVSVPDVRQMSPAEANRVLSSAGLNIKIVGSYSANDKPYAVKQSVEAGSKVPLGTIVQVDFTAKDVSD